MDVSPAHWAGSNANMWRGTFFKRFCQIGQLGGDAIPVV